MAHDATEHYVYAGPEVKTAIAGRVLYQLAAMGIAIFAIVRDVEPKQMMWGSIAVLVLAFLFGQIFYAARVRNGRTAEEKNKALKGYYHFSARFWLAASLIVFLMVHRATH